MVVVADVAGGVVEARAMGGGGERELGGRKRGGNGAVERRRWKAGEIEVEDWRDGGGRLEK